MLKSVIFIAVACGSMLVGSANAAENLCVNGSFSNTSEPLDGWTYDYRFLGNKHYMDNYTKVIAMAKGGGRSSVVMIKGEKDGSGSGVKMECKPIPYEHGYRYTCKMQVKDFKGRIYFCGYKWKPGIRPHTNPVLGELRTLYKSKAYTKGKKGWQTVELTIPGVKASPLSIKHMKPLRLITLYIWAQSDMYVDDVVITRVKDSKMGI